MSLIVATSRLEENNVPQPNERPSNFTNFFRSPIEIEPDSEIAVDSVKIQRTGNYTVGDRDFFCHYFGTDPRQLTNGEEYIDLTSISRTISMKRGTYALSGYVRQLTDRLNEQYADPRIFNNASVVVNTPGGGGGGGGGGGEEQGVEISFEDRGIANKAGNEVSASLVAQPVFNIANYYDYYYNDIFEPSDNFTWTPATGNFVRTGAEGTELEESKCVGILTGRPFGLNRGEFIAETISASAQPYIIGLSRPQIQIESYENSQITEDRRIFGINNLDYHTATKSNNETGIMDYLGGETINGPYELYDYAVMLDDQENIEVVQRVFDELDENSRMQSLHYWATGGSATSQLTKTTFYASYDGIRFEGFGDEVRLSFKQKGKDDSGELGTWQGKRAWPLKPMINWG